MTAGGRARGAVFVACAVAGASACATAVKTAPLACPEGGVPPVERAVGEIAPQPQRFSMMPTPPRDLSGKVATVLLLVDTAGAVVPDSTVLCGLPPSSYATELARSADKARFRPATLNGHPVRSHFQVTFFLTRDTKKVRR
jgi:hypothetical protein